MTTTRNATEGVTVIVPVYNEEQGLAPVLSGLFDTFEALGSHYEILVVDDGSIDTTAEVVSATSARLIRHPVNRGYGAALRTGLRHARHEVIAITDADGTYPSERIPDLLRCLDRPDCDMAVGARTKGKVAIPLIRRLPKWVLGRLANFVAGRSIPDINSGLRVFRRESALQFYNLFPDGFSFTTTLTLAMESNGYAVDYVPIEYHPRIGRSKIRPVYDTLNFVQLILRIALYFSPLKVFLPMAGLLILAGIVWGSFTWIFWGKLADTSTLVIMTAGIQIGVVGLLAEIINHRLPNVYRTEE